MNYQKNMIQSLRTSNQIKCLVQQKEITNVIYGRRNCASLRLLRGYHPKSTSKILVATAVLKIDRQACYTRAASVALRKPSVIRACSVNRRIISSSLRLPSKTRAEQVLAGSEYCTTFKRKRDATSLRRRWPQKRRRRLLTVSCGSRVSS